MDRELLSDDGVVVIQLNQSLGNRCWLAGVES